MRRSVAFKIASAICVIALLACAILVFAQNVHIGLHYANAEQYTAGGTSLKDTVRNLEINWTDGSVTIAYHAQDTIEIAETAPKAIPEDGALRWQLDGDTLRIQYAKSGFFALHSMNKALTVTLPESVVLESVIIDATSADVNAPALRAENVAFDLTSGNLLAATEGAKVVSVESTSGDIGFDQAGTADNVSLSSTSGHIRANLADVGSLSAHTTSGDIQTAFSNADEVSVTSTSGNIAAEGDDARKACFDSTSGRIDIRLKAFGDLRAESTSGGVTAALPSEPGFRADIETTSGHFDSGIALTRDGSDYACGDGSASLHIGTTSGNVLLKDVDDR